MAAGKREFHFLHVHLSTYEHMFTQDSCLFGATVYEHSCCWRLSDVINNYILLSVLSVTKSQTTESRCTAQPVNMQR